jgi:hypothetical protein
MAYADTKIDAFSETDFRIGKVVSKSLDVFFKNIITFTLIAGVVALPYIGLAALDQPGQTPTGSDVVSGVIAFVLILFLSPVATAVILHASFQHMRGRPVRLAESVSGGLSRILPLLGVMFLMTLGIALGMLLLLVPGVILMTMWYVAVPVSVIEKTGPVRSLGRSRELTKGFRWKIFALVMLAYIVSIIGNTVFVLLAAAVAGTVGGLVMQLLWQGIAGGFGSVLVAVAYYYLRVAKEGIDVDQIAAVFD